MELIHENIQELSEDLTDSWPPGQKTGAKPATRFDLPRQYYFNMTHMFSPDDFTNIRTLTEPESHDIEVRNVIEQVQFHNFIDILIILKKTILCI